MRTRHQLLQNPIPSNTINMNNSQLIQPGIVELPQGFFCSK